MKEACSRHDKPLEHNPFGYGTNSPKGFYHKAQRGYAKCYLSEKILRLFGELEGIVYDD